MVDGSVIRPAMVETGTAEPLKIHVFEATSSAALATCTGFPLLMDLPLDLLPNILGYLPLVEVSRLQRVCRVFHRAGHVVVQRKIARAKAQGVIAQNQRVKIRLELVLQNARRMSAQQMQLNKDTTCDLVQVKAFILGYPKTQQERFMKRLLECPNLAEHFPQRVQTVDGSWINLGLNIQKIPLQVRVPLEQYRQELEFQREFLYLSPEMFSPDKYEWLLQDLDRMISRLQTSCEFHQSDDNKPSFTFVSYLPRLPDNHPFETTTYETFVAYTKEPLGSRTLMLNEIGGNNNSSTGNSKRPIAVFPKNPGLFFTVEGAHQLDGMFDFAFSKIKENMDRIKLL